MLNGKRGFTLLELMIVVAVIGLLAAIAVPNLLRARMNAREASAVKMIQAFGTAMQMYYSAQNPPTFPTTTWHLSSGSPPYLNYDSNNMGVYTTGVVQYPKASSGGSSVLYDSLGGDYEELYYYASGSPPRNTFGYVIQPVELGTTGNKAFCIDHTGVVRIGMAGNTVGVNGIQGCSGGTLLSQ